MQIKSTCKEKDKLNQEKKQNINLLLLITLIELDTLIMSNK